ncbi:site-specific integrase [Deinococcus sp. D7000]|nr:site-specific integrase [Deinococcus sp. D7000]
MSAATKKRRGHGEVNVVRAASGRYRWRVWGKVGGKSERLTGTADTEKQARAAGQRARLDAEQGKVAVNRTMTLETHLEEWLQSMDDISDSTRKKYADLLRLHIVPGLGSVKLSAVNLAALREFYGTLRKADPPRRKAALGYSSRRQIHNILHAALGRAAADGRIPGNPAAVPDLRPTQPARNLDRVRAFTPEQAARFLSVADAQGERTGQVLAFLLLTGMRRGEALGLRWEQVTLDGKSPTARVIIQRTVSGAQVIEGPPKTQCAKRDVPLSPEVLSLLTRVRQRTTEEHSALYPDAPVSPYVFPSLAGTPYDPSNFTRVMRRICAEAGIPVLTVHELRHTFASLSAFQGVRIEVLSRILGHSDPGFTLRQYRHLYAEELAPVSLALPEITQQGPAAEDQGEEQLLPSVSVLGRRRKSLTA